MLDDIIPPGREKKLGKSALAHKVNYPDKPGAEAESPKPDETIQIDEAGKESKPTPKKKGPNWWHRLSRGRRIAVLTVVVLILLGGTASAYYILKPDSPPPAQPLPVVTQTPKPKPKTVASPLSGVQVAPKLAKRPVTGIMIENSLDARPQSGLQEAGVVFEAIAEGGITRFLTLYQENQPNYIGPVRSLRPYYIDWAKGFDASIAHVGGSPQALKRIRSGGKDLDQFFNAGSYWRVNSRAAPHNVYTSFNKLDALNKSKGYKTSKFTGWPRKVPVKAEDRNPNVYRIDLGISGPLFNVKYTYNSKDNTYYRSEGGDRHFYTNKENDPSPEQLHPKVVIAMITGYGIAADGQHSEYNTMGKGKVFIFQDGRVFKGTWEKKSISRQIKFLNNKGEPILLNPGQTWVTALGSSSMVNYKAEKPKTTSTQ